MEFWFHNVELLIAPLALVTCGNLKLNNLRYTITFSVIHEINTLRFYCVSVCVQHMWDVWNGGVGLDYSDGRPSNNTWTSNLAKNVSIIIISNEDKTSLNCAEDMEFLTMCSTSLLSPFQKKHSEIWQTVCLMPMCPEVGSTWQALINCCLSSKLWMYLNSCTNCKVKKVSF